MYICVYDIGQWTIAGTEQCPHQTAYKAVDCETASCEGQQRQQREDLQ